jgi:MoxR-like ATPase
MESNQSKIYQLFTETGKQVFGGYTLENNGHRKPVISTTPSKARATKATEKTGTTCSWVQLKAAGQFSQAAPAGEHRSTPALMQLLSAGQHCYLVGPAGSGKTTAAEKCAERLNLPFYCQSVGAQTTQSQLLGFTNATGQYVPTHFRQAYETGGVFLLDEIDAGNANVLTALNAALANGVCSFPDRMVKRHENFRCVAAANTFGTGADRQYVGRNQLDAASIDRFAFLEWPYDEALEAQLANNEEWTKYVQSVRRSVAALKIRHVVSPRASIQGAKLLASGMSRSEVEEVIIWKGLDQPTRAKVLANITA